MVEKPQPVRRKPGELVPRLASSPALSFPAGASHWLGRTRRQRTRESQVDGVTLKKISLLRIQHSMRRGKDGRGEVNSYFIAQGKTQRTDSITGYFSPLNSLSFIFR